MHLAPACQAFVAVVQRTDHLCHLGFHIILCGLATSHLHTHVVFVVSRDSVSVREKIVKELKGQNMYLVLLQKCCIDCKLDRVSSCSCA
jgi:hypothetical protein